MEHSRKSRAFPVSLFLRPQAAAYLLLVVAAASWAGNHTLARAVGELVPPAGLAVVRWIIVTLVVLPFALAHLRADWPKLKTKPWLMVLFAVTGGGGFGTLQFVSLHYTTALNMGVVGSVAPAFIVAASYILFRDRLTVPQLLGVLVSLSGVVAIVSQLDPGRLAGLSFNGGDLIIIANMALWAIYSVCLRLRPAIHPMTFILSMAVISGLGNLPFAALEHAFGYRLQATELTLWTALYAAFVTTLLAFLTWNRGVDIVGAPRASAFLHTVPLFSALLATTLLGETIEAYHIVGFALILAGVSLAARPSKSQRAPTKPSNREAAP